MECSTVVQSIHSLYLCRTKLLRAHCSWVEWVGLCKWLSDKHELARNAYLDWLCCGKPRFGPSYSHSKNRAQFKLALRYYCKQHEDTIRTDSLANSLSSNDYTKFWKDIRKHNNNKIGKFANVVDECVGDENIRPTERWRTHFEKL